MYKLFTKFRVFYIIYYAIFYLYSIEIFDVYAHKTDETLIELLRTQFYSEKILIIF